MGPETEKEWNLNSGQNVKSKYQFRAASGSRVDPLTMSSGEI